MRLSDAQAQGAALLRAAGVEGASRDADRILAAVLGIEPGQLRITDDRLLSATESGEFNRGIAARALRQPVAQITGFRDFWAHRFKVTRDTLDPRPETEALVEAALARPWDSVLDLGTGTGAILISVLAARPGARGTGTDISEAALQVARFNARRIGVDARFRQADWFQGVEGRFDLILSNPPYIAQAEMAGLAPDVRDWEPHQALTDGGDGLGAYRAIAAGACDHLTPKGAVLVEIGPSQGAAVSALFAQAGAAVRVLPDLDGRDRVVLADFARKQAG
ncbi:peptide chain release factor N(5)-glutamine methyltransferase [Paracoccus aestuarii]|uniref:Release factor glutamine methyltransferase n=1 Tax=Paracoccus aestuarii TaxID=453842 RepID=A0A419A2D1_9RHOB|nr:peptide chain release factor N(5)-glutamine methyltransferase [Paracoccus aestuarii]RJL07193.1 peptide chain release factor N(5)-glutamine methyltransferase [Paracoccus aestuarii]WCQ99609.1 peptide chain release factor N(5)-glutamine methyltransferase [Paracoccus aestuarii]